MRRLVQGWELGLLAGATLVLGQALTAAAKPPARVCEDWRWLVGQGKFQAEKAGPAVWAASGNELSATSTESSRPSLLVFDTSSENFVFHGRFPLDGKKHHLLVGVSKKGEESPGTLVAVWGENDRRMIELLGPDRKTVTRSSQGTCQASTGGWCDCEIMATGPIHIRLDGGAQIEIPAGGATSAQLALVLPETEKGPHRWRDLRLLPLPKDREFVPMVEDDDLQAGWYSVGPEKWTAKDNVVTGETVTGAYGWLVTDREYGDFVMSFQYRWTHGNSGVQFRSWLIGEEMHGYQADIDPTLPGMTGGLYDEHERATLAIAPEELGKGVEAVVWQTYEISALGPDIRLFHNGIETAHFTETLAGRPPRGLIALQVHSIKLPEKVHLEWKDLRILNLDPKSPWE